MTIDKQKLKALAEAAGMAHGWYQETSFGLRGVSGRSEQAFIAAASPATILALLAEIERLMNNRDMWKGQVERQAAKLEAMHKALRNIAAEVDGNIRPTVRDCVNGQNNIQDIYGYCDQIEAIAVAAMKVTP